MPIPAPRGGVFQSTLPAGGATKHTALQQSRLPISIHAPRRGSDYIFLMNTGQTKNFNPRSPQGERRWKMKRFTLIIDFNPRSPQGERLTLQPPLHILSSTFQSTLPAGGATETWNRVESFCKDFNPRSPQGERQTRALPQSQKQDFNPRSPQGERRIASWLHFAQPISIHAPRRGSDTSVM